MTTTTDRGDWPARVAAVHTPVRVDVTGRAGVGRSTLIAALGPLPDAVVVETDAWDRPGHPDPRLPGEIVVLVVLDPPRAVDVAAASLASEIASGLLSSGRLIPVLAKADTLADPAAALARASTDLATTCLDGRDLDAVREGLRARVHEVRVSRAREAIAHLHAISGEPAVRDDVEEFLAGDDGVRLAALADGAEPVGPDALARARYWRGRMQGRDADEARSALVRHRAAVRQWLRDG